MSQSDGRSGGHMERYAWERRPVVVFADGAGDGALAEQRAALEAERAGLVELDMVVVEVVGDRVSVDGQPVDTDMAGLRARYNVAAGAGFTVLLVGKDTGVKLRRDEPVSAEVLFVLIDTMPMRRNEMRESRE